jgi:hypothetical protein
LVEIYDSERRYYEEQHQQNYSEANYGVEHDEHILDHEVASPPDDIRCHYCNVKKCPCCLLEANYYYDYGLCRRKIKLCSDCYNGVYGNGRKISSEIVTNAFIRICETITNYSTITINLRNRGVNYFDAVKYAYDMNPEVRTYLGENCSIDKNLRGLWSFTYAIINGRERGIKVLDADPDNLILDAE